MKLKMNFIRAAFVYGAAVAILCTFFGCEKKQETSVSEAPYQRSKDPAYTNRLHQVETAQATVKARLVQTYNAIAAAEQKISDLKAKGEGAAAELKEAERQLADLVAVRNEQVKELDKCRKAALGVVQQGLMKERESAKKAEAKKTGAKKADVKAAATTK